MISTTGLRELDQAARSASTCPHCGKPQEGAQWARNGGRWARHENGSEYVGASVETRAEAGLCECARVSIVYKGVREEQVYTTLRDALDCLNAEFAALEASTVKITDAGRYEIRGSTESLHLEVAVLWRERHANQMAAVREQL